ncbi:MAG: response regulator transcription factor [Candidatus Eremiobacteraeota bacterium]|nr:response regulator transcription factor [Candidatus Eremiobacteraeota bacterium]MBV9700822.1 response regulator transcription factor [Candidatus Eremiobacteraeota bacterium]
MKPKRILVVEDEPEIAAVLREYLEREGLLVESCDRVSDALDVLARQAPDLILLDVTLKDGSGLDVLRAAALPESRIPTIMLTARSAEADRVLGLELGADDYVTKPFSPREVVARVRSVLRRTTEARSDKARAHSASVLRVGNLEIDRDFHEVRVDGYATKLTATEFKILSLLAEHPGEVFTRSHLLDSLNDTGEIYERTLDRHINNLRKKIERDPREPEHVLTVYGVGYKMSRP